MDTVTFPGSYKSLEKISDFVGKAAQAAGLDAQAIYAVQLAVDEACCNIIDHAYGGEGIGDVQCTVHIRQGELTIILRDQGKPYQPARIPTPRLHLPLSRVKSRGVGRYLIQKLMDSVTYETSPESGNTLTLVKRRSQAVKPGDRASQPAE